jgi:serine/threonine protein kinase
VPLRELRATSHDPENVATTALSSRDSAANANIDHHMINLDDSSESRTQSAKSASNSSERTGAGSPDYTSQLSDSDAAALMGERDLPDDADFELSPSLGNNAGGSMAPCDLKSLGRYQIQGVLGKGAMGTVYLGIDPAINRPLALKTIRLDFVSDPEELAELKERLHREGQAAGKLSHPNIVTIYDVGSEGSLQYIAMEYLQGQTLEDMIKKKTRFNYRIIAQMISQICSALQYAHDQGIVHRDVKPANIMVLSDYRIKVMDFGIARVDSNSMTKTGIAMGTPNYISPEQLRGREIDRRADIFSLGVMMYELLLGKRPFKGENLTSLMYAILNHEPEKPSSVRPQIPLLFDHIIAKALKKDPADRYQKAADVIVDLHDFVESFAHN